MGASFHPALNHCACGALGETRFAQIASLLWDSRRQFSQPGAPGTSLFPRLPLNLWDSKPTVTNTSGRWHSRTEKSKSHFTPGPHQTLENQWANTKLFPLWDGCDFHPKPDAEGCQRQHVLRFRAQDPGQGGDTREPEQEGVGGTGSQVVDLADQSDVPQKKAGPEKVQ